MNWIKKWKELERLVLKKYATYISIIGLGIEEYFDAGVRGAQVWLKIRRYSFLIGYGKCGRITAINRAIHTIKSNREGKYAMTVDAGQMLIINKEWWGRGKGNKKLGKEAERNEKKIKDELRIIEDCAFKP